MNGSTNGAASDLKRVRGESQSEFSLAAIRDALVRQEETIIFALIERGQFGKNKRVYERGEDLSLAPAGEKQDSFFEHFLYQTEILHAKLGRYRAGDLEHAFFAKRGLPSALLSHSPAEPWGKPLKANEVNVNEQILARYPTEVAQKIAVEEDDNHYGSTAVCGRFQLLVEK
jgi:chorismate mutase